MAIITKVTAVIIKIRITVTITEKTTATIMAPTQPL